MVVFYPSLPCSQTPILISMKHSSSFSSYQQVPHFPSSNACTHKYRCVRLGLGPQLRTQAKARLLHCGAHKLASAQYKIKNPRVQFRLLLLPKHRPHQRCVSMLQTESLRKQPLASSAPRMWEIRRKLQSRRSSLGGLPLVLGSNVDRCVLESACDGLASPRRLQQTSEISGPGGLVCIPSSGGKTRWFLSRCLWEVVAKLVAQT